MFLYKTQSSAKRRTDDPIFSGRSLMKMRNRTGPKTDPWGTPDRTGTGSEAFMWSLLAVLVSEFQSNSLICTMASCVGPCQRPLRNP